MNDDDKLSRLYQQSRTDEPPLKLDSAVLSHARKAAGKKSFHLSRWLAPVAAVATITLTASLIILMKSEHPDVFEAPALSDKLGVPEQVAPKPAPAELNKLKPETAEPEAMDSGKSRDQAEPARSRMAPAGEAAQQRQLLQEKRMLKAMPAAPAMQDAAGDAEKKSEGMAGAAVGNASGKAPAAASVTDIKKEKVLSPEAWLAEILRLHEEGREMEAAEGMKRFRLQYPDYKVPDDFPVR